MKFLDLLPISLFFYFGGSSANTIFTVVPATVGIGTQSSTVPNVLGSQVLTITPSVQSQILQLLRQPGAIGLNGGLTQVVVPGQQSLLNGAVVPVGTPGVSGLVSPSGVAGLSSGLNLVNVNGVPMILSTSGVGNNGVTTAVTSAMPTQVGAATVLQPYVTQPVIREVAEVQEVETPASLVQLDPMDAALLDMENNGQIHMEKYAWGRSSHLNNKSPQIVTADDKYVVPPEVLRSDLPLYYAPRPTGSIVSSQPVDVINQNRVPSQSQLRNPFVDANGKRKKHFEFYQYFRNLNLNAPQQGVVPVAVIPPGGITGE